MMFVLLREDGFGDVQLPVYAKRRIYNRDPAVGFGAIVVVTFILEYSCVTQNCEAMSESTRNEELAVIMLCQQAADVLAVCGRSLADIDCHVKH